MLSTIADILDGIGQHRGAAELRSRTESVTAERHAAQLDELASMMGDALSDMEAERDDARMELEELRDAARGALTEWHEVRDGWDHLGVSMDLLEALMPKAAGRRKRK